MGRRSTYAYGALLTWSPYGTVGSGLGQTIAKGPSGFIPPTHEVKVGFFFSLSLSFLFLYFFPFLFLCFLFPFGVLMV